MKVLLSGAEIAPLALALRQRGFAPVVVERSPRVRDDGYMLGLSDPDLDATERMGVAAPFTGTSDSDPTDALGCGGRRAPPH
jgi:2-polyprenyl-6-methoxyphenol hydroxylase-like FAD-dependent oxidoreductase